METAETLGRISFEPPTIQDAAEQLASLASRYVDVPEASLRNTLRSDRDSANELGMAVMDWYQDSCGHSLHADDSRVSQVQAIAQPILLDLLPTVGSDLRASMLLIYPTVGSIAAKEGVVTSKPTIAILEDPDISKSVKERVFTEWSDLASSAPSKDEIADSTPSPDEEFTIQADKWLQDYIIGTWDGKNVHVDPRILTPIARHIEEPYLRYQFVRTHIMYRPLEADYPPAFEICSQADYDLAVWLEQRHKAYNPDVDLHTGRRNLTKSQEQIDLEKRIDELESNWRKF